MAATNTNRLNLTRDRWHAMRHSSLDELTFNRDVDGSLNNQPSKRWTFEPSYSGVMAERLRTPSSRGLPTSMMETSLSRTAGLPQCSPVPTHPGSTPWRNTFQIKANPHLRGYVSDKITTLPFTPSTLARPPTRTIAHANVADHMSDTLMNLKTTLSAPPPFPAHVAQPLHVSFFFLSQATRTHHLLALLRTSHC